MNARQSSRLLSLVLFAALCALLTHWVLTLSSLRSLGAPREARVAQTDALETGAAVTLFGGGPQNGPRDVQVMGVVADLADGSGAAIVSVDGGAPQAVRAGKSLSSNLKLVEIKARSVVIERNGARQEIPLPASAVGPARPGSQKKTIWHWSGPGVKSGPLSTCPTGPPEIQGHFFLASRAGKMHFFFEHPLLSRCPESLKTCVAGCHAFQKSF